MEGHNWTTAERLLMDGLKLFKMRKDNFILCMLLLQDDVQRWDMITYMAKNLDTATEDDLVSMAYKLSTYGHDDASFQCHYEE